MSIMETIEYNPDNLPSAEADSGWRCILLAGMRLSMQTR